MSLTSRADAGNKAHASGTTSAAKMRLRVGLRSASNAQ
jgi:hypothetical protein